MESIVHEHWLGLTLTGLTGAGFGSLTVMLVQFAGHIRRIRQGMQQFRRQLPVSEPASTQATRVMRLLAPEQPSLPQTNRKMCVTADGYLQRQTSSGTWVTLRYVGEGDE